ncbi:Transposon Ty3-I Gag-Pol polyprotein, partial [Aphis craccivora]
AIAEIISEWKRHGVVVETDSPYASPVILVKQGSKNRLCVDYRRLNKQIIRHNFPLPDLREQVESLRAGHYFAQLDLATGYLQVPLSEAAQEKTAFITPDDTGQFTRMPFGLAGAPGEFTRLMRKVLGSLRDRVVKNYLDDWVIDAEDWPDMLVKLRMVLEKLRIANLTLKPSKCSFGASKIEFLGFVIGGGLISPGTIKSQAIEEFPTPKDVHGVRRFLGLTGFFRRFVRNYATMVEPLSRLTKKEVMFEWSSPQAVAFSEVKKVFASSPIFCMFDPKAAVTEVHTDASSIGLGAMLLQSKEEGTPLQMVYCISKKLGVAETHYHSSKLELMSIVWAVDRWRHFLLGIRFSIITDCQALVYLRGHRATKPQVMRWYDILQEYDFDIQHRPGTKMRHVDALSRDPVPDQGGETLDEVLAGRLDVCISLEKEDKVRMVQHVDEELRRICYILQKPVEQRTKAEKGLVYEYSMDGGLLYRWYQGRLLFVMPRSMRKSIVVAAHDQGGHLSVDKTISRIVQDYWFVGLRRYVKLHIRMCMECLMTKRPRGRQPGLLHPIPPGRRPFEVVHADHVGPFVTSTEGNRYILVLVDNLTKYVCLFPAADTSTEGVLYAMDEFMNKFGLPRKLITDRGTCFTSRRFENYCESHGVTHILNSTRRPQANGQVERINSTILAMLISQAEEEEWDKLLPEVQKQINNSESKVTRLTPFEMLHGYRPRFELGRLRELLTTTEEWVCPPELWEEARKEIIRSKERVKAAYDKHRHNQTKYTVGEVVVMTRVPVSKGESTKLQERYRGPLVVTEVLSNDIYRVAQLAEDNRRHFATTAHVSQLKSWKIGNEEIDVVVEKKTPEADVSEESMTPDFEISEEVDGTPTEAETTAEQNVLLSTDVRRSKRVKKKPIRLQDYIIANDKAE